MLDVVIVSYRCQDLLRGCLRSLRAHPSSGEVSVQVIDNASEDETAEMVVREFPEVDLIACDRNLGFARATNVGIRVGRGSYVLVLNPDTEVTAGREILRRSNFAAPGALCQGRAAGRQPGAVVG